MRLKTTEEIKSWQNTNEVWKKAKVKIKKMKICKLIMVRLNNILSTTLKTNMIY